MEERIRQHSPMPLHYQLIVLLSIVALSVGLIYLFESNRSTVKQSKDWQKIESGGTAPTISNRWPDSATKFQFARAAIGFSGRLSAFVVDGEVNHLKAFARGEFLNHWNKPSFVIMDHSESPFGTKEIERLEIVYGVKLNWLRDATSQLGTVYRSGEKSDQAPLIFIDPERGVLYSVVTD